MTKKTDQPYGIDQLELEIIDVEDLKPNPSNPNTHTAEQIDRICVSIKENGWGPAILANKDGMIIAGHGRLQAARKLGLAQVPVQYTDMDPGQALLLMIADNRLAELSDRDPEQLALVFQEIQAYYPDLNIEASGYTIDEIDKFIPDGAGQITDDDWDTDAAYAAAQESTITQPGDLWILGPHRLLCGDSTSPEDVARLMNSETAKMAFQDPPYNVAYDQKNGSPRKEAPKSGLTNNTIMNDDMSTADFKQFLDAIMARTFEACTGPVYICMSCQEWPRLMSAFEEAGGHWSSTIIWNKSNFVLSRKDYHPKFEPILYGWHRGLQEIRPDYTPILYGWREGDKIEHLDARNKSDVWDFAKPARNAEHPTMKPLELCAEAIRNSSGLGDLVVDLFGGSGSTLIAADQLGRACYTMELDPKYADVIVHRWETQTGQQAVRISDGAQEPRTEPPGIEDEIPEAEPAEAQA